MNTEILPKKVYRQARDEKIRALYKSGYSMNEICKIQNASKTTVFFAINGRGFREGRKRSGVSIKK